MPKYTNRRVPEGISSGHEHPLAEAGKSLVAVIVLFAVIIGGSYLAARLAAPHIPFAWERALAEQVSLPDVDVDVDVDAAGSATQRALAELGARVAAASDLPPDMTISIHYAEGDTVNAFATLGGHIVVHEGLLKLLDSENALAMLLGHEIAHIKNRDPIRGATSAVLASIAIGILGADSGFMGDLIGSGTLLTALHFSREQETQADEDAARAVIKLYGHFSGATDLFTSLQSVTRTSNRPPAFLASHPNLDERITNLRRLADQNGWPRQGKKTPRP